MTTWKTYRGTRPDQSMSTLTKQELFAKVPPLIFAPFCKRENASDSYVPGLHRKNQKGEDFRIASDKYPRPSPYRGSFNKSLERISILSHMDQHKTTNIKYHSPKNTLETSAKNSSNVAGALNGKVRRFNCPSCSRTFYYMCHLKVHERVSHGVTSIRLRYIIQNAYYQQCHHRYRALP